MKKRINKILTNKYMPFVLLFIILFIINSCAMFCGDDIWFANYMKNDYFNFIATRYHNWTSRIVIEAVLYPLVRVDIIVWRILNSLIYTIGIFIILKLVNKKQDVKFNYLGCLMFMIYPYLDMSSAGWVATTTNYLWCFGLGMLSFLPIINKENKKDTNKILYIISILGLIYGTNQEQSCAVILGFNILYLLNTKFIKKEKINKYNLVCMLLSIISLIFILTCPGNRARTDIYKISGFSDSKIYSIIQKLYFGIVPTMYILLNNKLVLVIFSIILTIGVFVYGKKQFSKILSIINLCLVLSVTYLCNTFVSNFPSIVKILNCFSSEEVFHLRNYSQDLALLMSLFIFFNLLYMILVIFKTKNLLPIFILLIGIGSRVIVGFTNSIFESGARTGIYLYMGIIAIILFIIYKLYTDKKFSNNEFLIFNGILIFIVSVNFLNTILY